MASATDVRIDEKDVRAAVERIIASPLFAESPRLSGFLRYLVEETLAGRRDRIKEYNIGVEVYGRPSGYDPKIDAIVRVEAGRLRSKLVKYYAGEGGADPVQIEVPRGTYGPVLSRRAYREPPTPASPPRVAYTRRRKGVVVAGVVVALALIALFRPPAEETKRLSLAILPLINVPSDPETARFARGFVEELTNKIAAEDAFPVASRTDSDRAAGSLLNVSELGRKLRVSAFLEGSVRRDSDRLGVTVQLITARNGYHVWSQSYESLPGRTAEFQERASNLIARTLRARFGGLPEDIVSRPPSRSENANRLYIRGHEAWLTQRKSGLFESVNYYRQAIAQDNAFAKAYEGIAASELFLASLDHEQTGHHVTQAKTAALKAIALDDRLADPHARLGNIFLRREWNFVEAERELQRSVVLEPGSSPVTRWYSEAARLREKYADARAELENGLLANPNSEIIETELAMLDIELDRLADAEMHVRRTLAGHPAYRPAHLAAGLLHECAGRFSEAEEELRSCANESEFGRLCLAALGHVYGAEHKRSGAMQVLRELEDFPDRSMSLAAIVYLGMDAQDRAVEALERAYAEKDKFLPLIKIDPRFQKLQIDLRFRALMSRLGLPVAIK